MQIHELLDNRKKEIQAEIDKLRNEQAEIDRMLGGKSAPVTDTHGTERRAVPATKDDAILEAITAGNTTPATISEFMRDKLGLSVNDASTRTRLSRMKAADKIAHDGNGWKLK